MISRNRIKDGYERGIIKLEAHSDGIVAKIGEYWFYFGGQTAEECDDTENFKKDIPKDTIIDEIYDILDEFRCSGFTYEYDYYDAILEEAGCVE